MRHPLAIDLMAYVDREELSRDEILSITSHLNICLRCRASIWRLSNGRHYGESDE